LLSNLPYPCLNPRPAEECFPAAHVSCRRYELGRTPRGVARLSHQSVLGRLQMGVSAAVDRPLGINPKKVLPEFLFRHFFVRDERAGVLDDPLTGWNVL